MKMYITIILMLWCCINAKAQQIKPMDTIFANSSKTVSLFFPKPLRQGIVGNKNFVFTYNTDKEQYFGLLQAREGEASNLLAITNDGNVYSYILKYQKKLPKLNYFIEKESSIGNEMPKEIAKNTTKRTYPIHKKNKSINEKVYAKNSESFLKNSRRSLNRSKQKYQIKLTIKDIVYQGSVIYYLVEIQNKSKIDYEVNYLKFFNKSKSSLKRKSTQKLQIKPIYSHQNSKGIKAYSKSDFVIVLPKFTIDGQKKILVELNELKGERNLELKSPNGSI